MYELSRIRLYSIGPAGARYADTVLDLRGVGAHVPDPAPTQADFFEEEPEGPPRRPAPAGVLFLENGGGKSVLLKLIFSVMLPGHRNTLGGASSGVLRKFLLADDCGHVALEWQHTLTGETVVVGKASEWRGRQVSNDPRKFAEAWYSFRPGPGMSLDSLPVAESCAVRPVAEGASGARGRRRTMKGFKDVLSETGRVYPNLDVVWEEIHDRWKEHLGNLGLDPELFRYQREMNADEGEAAGLFAVRHDADFTDLLLRAVTDTRDTDGLADLLHGFAHKLGRRAELTAERDFTAGSLEHLNRIAELASQRERSRAVHTASEERTRDLAARISACGRTERARSTELEAEVTRTAHTVTTAEGARAAASRIAAELAYRHASLALSAAEKAAASQRRELTEARTLYAAWQAAETVLRHRAAADRSTRVSAAIQEAERDAAPALAARARAAAELVHALHTAAEHSEAAAAQGEERSATLQEVSESAHRDATAAATAAERARSEHEHLCQRLSELEEETERAVREGWLEESRAQGDPAAAALSAEDTGREAVRAWEVAKQAATSAAERDRECATELSRAELAAARAADAAQAAQSAYALEREAAALLGAEPRLVELLSAANALSPQEVDRFAPELRELLEERIAAAERQLFEERTAAADDARILGALGEGGLLPPNQDVLATVEHLGEHGVPALPGWRYLAQSVPPADHAKVLAARPELVDGVVITDEASHLRAREVLERAALLPRSAVAVGTRAALLAPLEEKDAQTGGAVFLVPPNPAMHDEDAADGERRSLRERSARRDEEIRALAARLSTDRALAARLSAWRQSCPSGRLSELAEACEAADEAADEAVDRHHNAVIQRTQAQEAASHTARVRDQRQEAAQAARRRADALSGLAHRLRERGRWQGVLRELAEDQAECEQRAATCLERARAADEDRRAAQRAADDSRRTARALRAERAEISGVLQEETPEGREAPEGEPPRPTVSLPSLREAYRSASQLYEKVGVGADLRAEQARAESEESVALAQLNRLTNKVRAKAAQLLDSADGADGPSRQAAAGRAEELVTLLEARASTASEQLGRLRGEAERLAPEGSESAHAELSADQVPKDADQAQRSLRLANAELATKAEALESARAAHEEVLRAHRAAQDATGAYEEISAMLRELLRDPTTGESEPEPKEGPFQGSPAEAREAAARARRSLRGHAGELAAVETTLREACDLLVRHANATRFEPVRTPARSQIRELPAAALPEHAAAWAEAFAPRLRVLTDELEQLERNRGSIVDRLRGLVEASLATLRSAQRLSRLPQGLGEWSGQEFVRIRFEDPDQATLTERLGQVIDEATSSAVRKNSDLRRDGMTLLLRGVHAALEPRGVSVEILKPDAVLRAERVPVGQMGDVFSGGQLLTAAIALYCTMAALRSNDRGRDEHRFAGTLFLDNPIGRANATYLLELQRAVADALGVQLLYTTGLFDTTALAEFPLVIRLRNDADLRAGLKYISVEEHLRPGLPQPESNPQQVHGEITATRVFRRPTDDQAVGEEGTSHAAADTRRSEVERAGA